MNAGSEDPSGMAIESVGDVLFIVWRDAATIERTRYSCRRVLEAVAKSAEGILVLLVILPSSDPPGSAARAESQATFAKAGTRLRYTSTVAIGDNFRGAVVRSIMRAMTVISGQSKRHGVASTVAEGIAQLASHATPSTPARAELEAAITRGYATLGVADPSMGST